MSELKKCPDCGENCFACTGEVIWFEDVCPDCEGSGELAGDYFSEDGMTTCNRCGGKGAI